MSDTKLSEILREFERMTRYRTEHDVERKPDNFYSIEATEQAIMKWVNDVIGEDEPIKRGSLQDRRDKAIRSILRAEQRKRAGL